MKLFTPEFWPVHVICVGMLAAAVIDWWKFKVPNKLTFPLIISGWVLGLCNNFGLEAGVGGIGAALAGTFLGLALLLPMYAIGGMGAGDVKMTMGFGAWIGAFYGFGDAAAVPPVPNGMWIIVYAFCAGTIAGGIIALGMIVVRGNYQQNVGHVKEIVGDMFSSQGLGDIAAKANRRRSRWHRLPYGVPLCIGFLGYLLYLGL
jgi:prepilin peptidase CpaA